MQESQGAGGQRSPPQQPSLLRVYRNHRRESCRYADQEKAAFSAICPSAAQSVLLEQRTRDFISQQQQLAREDIPLA